MKLSVTREDFVREGKRYASVEVLNEADRLHPLGMADIGFLSAHGYSQPMIEELGNLRDQLQDESANRQKLSGAKQGARANEAETHKDGINILRQGVAQALVAISRRQVPSDEDAQVTREKAADLKNQIKVISADVQHNSVKLRTLLESLKAILSSADFAPPQGGEAARVEYLTKLDRVVERLETLAETKKSLKDNSKDKTSAVDEIHGRILTNLKLLVRVGRACFEESGDMGHAALYNLRGLRRGKHVKTNDTQTASVAIAPIAVSASSTEN